MLTSTVPVLYHAPSIMNQIYAYINDGLINSEVYTKKSSIGTSLKLLLDNLFVPIKGEASAQYDRSREKQSIKTYDDLSRTVGIIKSMQAEEMKTNAFMLNESLATITLLDGIFNLELKRSLIDKSNMIHITHSFNEYVVHGVTSIDNWTSKSLTNQILQHGELTASALVFPLSIKENKIEAKFACIFVL